MESPTRDQYQSKTDNEQEQPKANEYLIQSWRSNFQKKYIYIYIYKNRGKRVQYQNEPNPIKRTTKGNG